uniref:(northern house mosquito) hypothetical protein n=1 Tax=Culex pipiens TaxID=7175 RepID=A0A8D8ADL0_CULPI
MRCAQPVTIVPNAPAWKDLKVILTLDVIQSRALLSRSTRAIRPHVERMQSVRNATERDRARACRNTLAIRTPVADRNVCKTRIVISSAPASTTNARIRAREFAD